MSAMHEESSAFEAEAAACRLRRKVSSERLESPSPHSAEAVTWGPAEPHEQLMTPMRCIQRHGRRGGERLGRWVARPGHPRSCAMSAVRLEPLSAPWLAILTAASIAVDTRRVELRWIPPRLLERLVASGCLSVRLAAPLLLLPRCCLCLIWLEHDNMCSLSLALSAMLKVVRLCQHFDKHARS